MREKVRVFIFAFILCFLCACDKEDDQSDNMVSSRKYKELQEQYQEIKDAEQNLTNEKATLEKELTTIKEELQELEATKEELLRTQNILKATEDDLKTTKNLYEAEKREFAEYKEKMSAYEGLSDKEREAREAEARMMIEKEKEEQQKRAQEEEAARKKEEEERKKAEEKAKKEAEEKEKKGYETGITYDQLARTPDKYKGEKVKFTGEVLQILEGDEYNEMRLSVHKNSSGWYDSDQVIYCAYNPKIVDYRILEGDIITIYGVSHGIVSYESVMHTTITLPLVVIDKLEQKK